ncbi:uncharacterized protein, partial [Cherax quadricarinatus]|uniref:uncharacterized protein n=1 Tax=Cherax quadricarinatus TaxID=27406 RepID=UPI00387E6DCE
FGTLLFPSDSSNTDGSASEDEFQSFDEVVTETNDHNTGNSGENPDDPQPSTSAAGPSCSRSVVPERKRKPLFSHIPDSDVSSGDDSDSEYELQALENTSSSNSEAEYSPVKRQYIRQYMRSGSVPYAIPRGRSTSWSTSRDCTTGTDSENEDDSVAIGMENVHGGGGAGREAPAVAYAATHTAASADLQQRPPSPTHPPHQPPQPQPPQPQPPVSVQYPPADCTWDWQEAANFVPNPHQFDDSQSGIRPSCTLGNNASELECFELFFDEPLMEIVVRESNRYFNYTMANTILSSKSRLHQWKETTVAEMYLFFATIMLMPHVYKHTVKSYWSTDRLIATPGFSDIMRVNRFVLLLRMLHFSDKTRPDRNDRLYKIRNVFVYLKEKFNMYFYPFRKLVIDESWILFKGRLFQAVHTKQEETLWYKVVCAL